MRVLGISALFHDSAAALLIDGEIIAAAQEERFSRQKNDASLPLEAVAFCLAEARLAIQDIDWVVFYEKPLVKFERLLSTSLNTFPRGLKQFVRAMGTWLGSRLWLKGQLARSLGCDPDKILFSDHHLSHAASAFFSSPFQRAVILTADGVGEWTTTGIHVGSSDAAGSHLDTVYEQRFPHSMGLLYSALTAYLGFEVNQGEYKVMGLAAYGQPHFQEAFAQLCELGEDGSLSLDMSYFTYDRHPERSVSPKLEALFEAPDGLSTSQVFQRRADIAATLQDLCERWLLNAAREAHRRTGERHLCLAGGVALNSVANGRLLRESPFESIYVQPAAGDAGGALGAAQLVTHVMGKLPRTESRSHAFFGKGYEPAAIETFLKESRFRHQQFETWTELYEEVARRLAAGEVGGWHQGRFEWGPRALGARSILADPRHACTRDRVNAKVKFREPFRPFAPAVLAEDANHWFDLGPESGCDGTQLYPFMLAVTPLKNRGKEHLPAITHVDGSARVQTVTPSSSPRLRGLLEAFKARTGVGVLLNTSLNLRGEPIAASPAESYSVFDRSDLDFLVMERSLVARAA